MNRTEIMCEMKNILMKSDYYFLQDMISSITEETRINEDLSMDSMQIMEFIVDIESTFDIRFDFSKIDAGNVKTVFEIINMIESTNNKI